MEPRVPTDHGPTDHAPNPDNGLRPSRATPRNLLQLPEPKASNKSEAMKKIILKLPVIDLLTTWRLVSKEWKRYVDSSIDVYDKCQLPMPTSRKMRCPYFHLHMSAASVEIIYRFVDKLVFRMVELSEPPPERINDLFISLYLLFKPVARRFQIIPDNWLVSQPWKFSNWTDHMRLPKEFHDFFDKEIPEFEHHTLLYIMWRILAAFTRVVNTYYIHRAAKEEFSEEITLVFYPGRVVERRGELRGGDCYPFHLHPALRHWAPLFINIRFCHKYLSWGGQARS